MLHSIEGFYITGYADGGDAPGKELQLLPGAVTRAQNFLRANRDTHVRFERVVDLVQGFETPFGLEVLSTVHWVATHGGAKTLPDVVAETYAWGERKLRFTERQIHLDSERPYRQGLATRKSTSTRE